VFRAPGQELLNIEKEIVSKKFNKIKNKTFEGNWG
jgi:hypothetical protein